MISVGAYEAKSHLAELLDKVEKGEQVLITRHRRPIARLIPARKRSDADVEDAIRKIRAFGDSHTLGGLSIRSLIEEGRR